MQEIKNFNIHIDKKICIYEAVNITYASVSISASTLVDKELFLDSSTYLSIKKSFNTFSTS